MAVDSNFKNPGLGAFDVMVLIVLIYCFIGLLFRAFDCVRVDDDYKVANGDATASIVIAALLWAVSGSMANIVARVVLLQVAVVSFK